MRLLTMFKHRFLNVGAFTKLTPMADFTQNYTTMASPALACAIIHHIGGWDRFALLASAINKGEGTNSVVHRYLDTQTTNQLFKDNLDDMKAFFGVFFHSDAHRANKVIFIGDRDILCGQLMDALDGSSVSNPSFEDIAKWVTHHATQTLCADYDLYITVN